MRHAPVQDEEAVRVANFALSFCASRAFCFWKFAGAACASAARMRTERVESLAETMATFDQRVFG